MSNEERYVDTLRHDTAHVMAMAVQELYPETKVTIGPVIENGFFYDFSRETPFNEKDLIILSNNTDDIIEYVDGNSSENEKKYNFFELLEKN